MRVFYLLCLLFLQTTTGNSQKHDYIWLMGQNHQSIPMNSGTVIDFNTTPPNIYYEFRVKLDNPQVIIRDAIGREVLREPLRVVDGKVRQDLKVGHLAAGVYFCSIEAEENVVWQGKVIKQ